MNRLILLLFLFLLPLRLTLLQGQDPVEASFSSDTVLIGDQFFLSFRCEADSLVQYQPIPQSDTLFKNFEVLGVFTDTLQSESGQVFNHHFLLTNFEAGWYRFNSLPVLAVHSMGTDTVPSFPLQILVYAPEIDTTAAFRDIKPLINTPFILSELKPYLLHIIGGLAIIALFIFLLRKWLKRRKGGVPAEIREQLSPYQEAHRGLSLLKQEKLWQKGEVKEYYTRLTGIVRVYLETGMGIPAMESTSNEIIAMYARKHVADEETEKMLADVLSLSDLVKFARQAPTPAENEMNLAMAFMFLEKTKPAYEQHQTLVEEERKEKESTGSINPMLNEKNEPEQ